jgi:hypothetical protein
VTQKIKDGLQFRVNGVPPFSILNQLLGPLVVIFLACPKLPISCMLSLNGILRLASARTRGTSGPDACSVALEAIFTRSSKPLARDALSSHWIHPLFGTVSIVNFLI